jgi:hypothetical protein
MVRLAEFDSVPPFACPNKDELVQAYSFAFVLHVSEQSP